jgi:hypothetical protein
LNGSGDVGADDMLNVGEFDPLLLLPPRVVVIVIVGLFDPFPSELKFIVAFFVNLKNVIKLQFCDY